ncbi:MAG: ubiquitin-like domain-containing protein [Caldilineaceae bacterium]
MASTTLGKLKKEPIWTVIPIELQKAAVALVVVMVMWGLWRFTIRTVYVTVDGVSEPVPTHRRTVGALMLDMGLTLRENDRVSVALDSPVAHNMAIEVARTPTYRLLVDGRDFEVTSWGRTPLDVFLDAGVAVDSYDQSALNGEPFALNQTLPLPKVTMPKHTYAYGYGWGVMQTEQMQLHLYRAMTIQVNDGGLPFTIRTTAQTVGEALRQAKITLYLGDIVRPSLGNAVNAGLRISIARSTPVSLRADGRYVKTRTQAATVADALTEMGIGLSGQDQVVPPPETELIDDMEIAITRVSEDIEVEEDIVPYETVFVPDRALAIDAQQMVNPGAEGITRRRSRVRYEDGQETDRKLEDTWVAQEPAQRVIAYGQKIEAQSAVVDGQQITYWRKVRMLATSYSAGTAGVSPDAANYGRTYTGETMRHGIVAVDPQVIPLRTQVFVPGYGPGDALDMGSAIRARRIDLGFDDANLQLWNRWVDVYLLWPPPPEYQITWVLPNWPLPPR